MRAPNSLRRLHRRFIASTRGVAAIEFAMIAPVLATLFLASFDGGRAVAIYMKVRSATYSLAAITNQYETIASTDMTGIMQVTSDVLAPYSTTPAAFTVSQIKITKAGSGTVAWSYSQGGSVLTSATLPSNLSTCGTYPCYLIYSQVSYTYTPLFGLFTTASINLSDSLYVTPRSSACVVYTPKTGTAC
ncbi:MAG: TadE/TadG family type IV pilus assembly protein [Xanthobacteraceae bacterium]